MRELFGVELYRRSRALALWFMKERQESFYRESAFEIYDSAGAKISLYMSKAGECIYVCAIKYYIERMRTLHWWLNASSEIGKSHGAAFCHNLSVAITSLFSIQSFVNVPLPNSSFFCSFREFNEIKLLGKQDEQVYFFLVCFFIYISLSKWVIQIKNESIFES